MFLNCHVIKESNLEKQKIHTHYPFPLCLPDCQENRGQTYFFYLIRSQWFRYSVNTDV